MRRAAGLAGLIVFLSFWLFPEQGLHAQSPAARQCRHGRFSLAGVVEERDAVRARFRETPAGCSSPVKNHGNPAQYISDIEKVELVFKDGVGYDSAKLIESVRGAVGLH